MAQLSTRTVSYRAPRLAPASAELVALCGMAVFAATLGWAVGRFDGFGANPATAVLLTVGGLATLAVVAAGPVPCLLAIAGLTASGLSPEIGHVGGVNLTLADAFFCGLAGWWLLGVIGGAEQRLYLKQEPIAFGQGAALLFFAFAGLTLLKVATSDSGHLSDALISWLRLVQTAALAWLAASLIQNGRDLRLLLVAVTAGAVVAIVYAAVGGGALPTQRFHGTLNTPNTLGLVSGFVLVIAAFGGVTPKVRDRIVLAGVGVLGLLLAKSVASFVGTGFALALGASLASATPGRVAPRATRSAMMVAMAGVLVFGAVQFLRPNVTPGSTDFTGSSAYQRIVVGTAGLEIFQRNPLLGAGWRESNSPRVIGNRTVNVGLRQRFPNANPTFYPDVSPTSVHNTYIQLLADLGLVGFVLFVAMIVAVGKRVRMLLGRLGPGHELRPQVWTMSLCLLLVIVWLNDNPLYGGEPETVIPALFVGALAATSRLVPRSDDARVPRER